MRNLLFAVLAASAAPAFSQDAPAPALDLSGTVAVVSDYRFRGISLSDHGPAAQGSATLAHRSGVYATVWASTLDGFGVLGGSHREVDLSAGYRTAIGPVTLDGGLLYYAYPGSKGGDFEFFEPYASATLARGALTAKASVAFAPAQSAIGDNSNLYTAADLGCALGGIPVTLKAHLGRSHGRTTLTPGGNVWDWSVGADATWKKFTLGLAYVDTNIDAATARAVGARPRDVGSGLVAALTIGW